MESLDLFSQVENNLPATTGDKDLGCKWNFVQKPKGTMKRDREDSSFDPFKDNEVRCLVREYIQNSIDAAQKLDDNRNKKVLVTFSYGKMTCSDYPNLIQSLIGRLKACSKRSQQLPGSKDIYKSKYEFLSSRRNSTIGYLKVSDFYTTGMNYVDDDIPSAFDSCVHCSSSSYKLDGGYAGGSHGLGKTVGFVNSPFNAVYYSTKDDESGKTFGEGVVRLCTHKYKNEEGKEVLFEADAFYNKGGSPNSGKDIPVIFRREQSGTDAFVLGMEENEGDIITMKKELLRGFFYAIYMEVLDVIICGEKFTKTNIAEKMLEYFPEPDYTNIDMDRSNRPELNFNPRPYFFEIAMRDADDDNHVLFTTDDFPDQFPILGHATLQIWKSDDITAARSLDKIIFMRNKLMTVEVRKYYSSKGFYGIMVCDGDGAIYLRMLEDVRHDKWDEKELKDMSYEDKKNARKALRELESFKNECLKKLFPEEHDKQLEINSLKKRRIGKFGSRSEENEEDNIWPTTNIIEKEKNLGLKSGSFTIFEEAKGRKKKKKKGTITDVEPEADPLTRPETDLTPEPDPNPAPNPNPEPRPEPTPKPNPNYVEGDDGEDFGTGETENPNVEREREIKLDGRNKRLKPLHNEDFACKLEIRVPKDYYDCRLVLDIQADEGLFPLDLKNVSAGCQIRSGVSNEIYGFDLKADASNVIKFTPQENVTLYSLNIKIYGH